MKFKFDETEQLMLHNQEADVSMALDSGREKCLSHIF